MYKCKYFKLKELVHPVTYKKFGRVGWKFLDEDCLRGLDIARELFGSLTINDWAWGGKFKDSGYRQSDSRVGSKWSTHRRGCGFDIKSKKYNGAEMRKIIRDGLNTKLGLRVNHLCRQLVECFNEIELGTTSWLHLGKTNRKSFKWIPYK